MIRNGTISAQANQVVWESEPLPNECVVVRTNFDEALRVRLAEVLAGLTETERGMLPWPYTGFVPATHEPYRGLEQMGRDLGVLRGGG
jgi:ABC-type phosphate/phosphonate transport system substrate-binding protein